MNREQLGNVGQSSNAALGKRAIEQPLDELHRCLHQLTALTNTLSGTADRINGRDQQTAQKVTGPTPSSPRRVGLVGTLLDLANDIDSTLARLSIHILDIDSQV